MSLEVSKTNAYAVIQVKDLAVDKVNIYAVIQAKGLAVDKTIAYAILQDLPIKSSNICIIT